MNKRLLKFFSLVSGMTLLSRLLGFVRDIVFAYFFGATAQFDAFLVAFKIPNFMRRLFAEGAFSQAFVPVLSKYQTLHSHEETQRFVNSTATALGVSLLLVILLVELATPLFVMVFAPGFVDQPEQFNFTVDCLRVTFPYLFFIAMTALSGAILNCWNKFGIPAFTPVLLNITLIFAAVGFAQYFDIPVKSLAWGVFVAGVIQLVFQMPFLYRLKLLPKIQVFWKNKGVMRVLRLMLPALLGVSVAQISLLIDTLFASFLESGSIAWLYYSERLTYFPLGVIGVALSTVIMPHLSRAHASKAYQNFSATLNDALKTIFLIGLPATIGLFMLAGPLLSTLFQSGHFMSEDVLMAKKSLKTLALGLPAFMGIKILISSFYSRQNIKTPVKIAIAALLVNVVLNAILIFPMAHAGLALATSIAAWFNLSLLFYCLRKEDVYQPLQNWRVFFFKILLANSIIFLLLRYGVPDIQQWLIWGRGYKVIILFTWIIITMALYFTVLRTLRIKIMNKNVH